MPKGKVALAVKNWQDSKAYLQNVPHPSKCAHQMGIKPAQLHRYCLETFGQDFRTWRTTLRIEDAKKMLLEERTTPVSVIARRVGITDRSNFSRLFREHTGMLPTAWRAQQLIKQNKS
ncbi:MAG: AraC family transcriptional regulator [Bacteroidales bacterium]|nr:AraC family transcriptional regulator [Bacteroidales bacterium]